ncbi:MAG: T9SS type A sorting domain-containing protein [Ignavibacteria bacterium]
MKFPELQKVIVILLVTLSLNAAIAKEPAYKLSIENLSNVAPNALEFDIYLQQINSKEAQLNYIIGQYFFNFNSDIANGGRLTYSLIKSDLPPALTPRNPSVSGNQLRLAMNSVGNKENLPVISNKSPGTLVARMRLQTSAETLKDVSLDLVNRSGPENPYTKIFSYADNKIIDITNHEEMVSDNLQIPNNSSSQIPREFAIAQNYPNPFNPSTSISFDIPSLSEVSLSVFDLTGREIASLVNETLEPGSYSYKWNASQLSSGIYFYRIKAGSFVQTKKMVLIK